MTHTHTHTHTQREREREKFSTKEGTLISIYWQHKIVCIIWNGTNNMMRYNILTHITYKSLRVGCKLRDGKYMRRLKVYL